MVNRQSVAYIISTATNASTFNMRVCGNTTWIMLSKASDEVKSDS